MKKKPIIGIITKHTMITNKDIRPYIFVRDELKDAILDCGGIAIGILPSDKGIKTVDESNEQDTLPNMDKLLTIDEQENMITQIKLCDGVVFAGGNHSDVYETFIANYCYKHNIPALGICCGHNNLIRGIGGTTIAMTEEERAIHNSVEDYVHTVKIDKNSLLYKIFGTETLKVNSRHKYTIKDCKNLKINATDDNGRIEGCEAIDKTFYLAVRWHPESLYKIDDMQKKIFDYFVSVCENGK